MTAEVEKITQRARLWGLVSIGMTLGIWDMVEESSVSLSPVIGKVILHEIEKNLGLEIAGEKPENMLVELGRIFVDEFGIASEVKVENTNSGLQATLVNAVGTPEFAALQEKGVEKLFSQPYYCAGLAALARQGCKVRGSVEVDKSHNSQVVRFELL